MKKVITHHIEKVRTYSEHKKRWWVAIATAIVMCIVVALWILYISKTLPQTANPNTVGTASEEPIKKPSVIGSVIEGIKLTLGDISSSFRGAKNNITKDIQETIKITTKKEEQTTKTETEIEKPFQPNEAEEPEQVPLP